MLSPLATILFTWAAIHAYVGVFYCMLHLRRPMHRAHLAFGLVCFSASGWILGSALLVEATTFERAAWGATVQQISAFAGIACLTQFSVQIADLRESRLTRAAYVLSGGAALALVSGVFFEMSGPAPRPSWGFSFAPDRMDLEFSPLGLAFVIAVLGFAAWNVWIVARASRRHADLRGFMWALGIALAAAMHDTFARVTHMRTIYLVDHAAIFPILAVSMMLLRRFVRSVDELGHRTQELRQSYSELRITQEELVRKEQLAAVGELSAVIAHEVRNPLAIIKNAGSSLRRSALRPDDRFVLLGILDEEVDRLARLVRDLLAYARPVEPRGRAIDLARVIEDAVSGELEGHEAPDSIELSLELTNCPTIHGDPDLLRQALAAVLDNAVAAMPSGGKLSVRTKLCRLDGAPAVSIQFADSGEGMDSFVLAKARDPFFTTRAAGTGLGLAIVERVIKNHGGTIAISSNPGQGSTVDIVLRKDPPSSLPPPPEGA